MKEALYYQSLPQLKTQCLLCPRNCVLLPNQRGFCLNRQNLEGKLYALNYQKVAALNEDPIEKKPLYHFYPGQDILSLGSYGCSLDCSFCQNASIARQEENNAFFKTFLPQEIVSLALKQKNSMIAYTYNEPYIWFEQVLETSILAKEQGIKNVLVSNGFFNKKPWKELAPFIDGVNFDFKGEDDFYKNQCKGWLSPVLKSIEYAFKNNIHIEITALIINGLNDNPSFFNLLIKEISQISPQIPLHLSRHFPRRHLKSLPTNEKTLYDLYDFCKEKLHFVYLGNMATFEGEQNTFCPHCKGLLIEREGAFINLSPTFKKGECLDCKTKIYGVF